MTAIALYAANALGLAAIVRLGGKEDRIAALLFVVAIAVTPWADGILLGNWRLGAALVDLALLLGFWILAERYERWWLVMATGFQLIAVITFLVPWLMPGAYFMWTGVTIRLAVWVLLSVTFFVGAWESWAARRFAKEAIYANPHLRRRRSAVVPPQRRPSG